MSNATQQVGEAVGRALARLDERRAALGLVGLPEPEAQLRMRALERLTVDQFVHLLGLGPDDRAGMIAALVAGQRRAHEVARIGAVAVSSFDGRYLYGWLCACGAESAGDLFAAEAARDAWRRHAGIPAERPGPDQAPGSRGTGQAPPARSAGRPPGAPRAGRVLESTE